MILYTSPVATLAQLLADPDAVRVYVLKLSYLDSANVAQTLWVAQGQWADPPGGPVGSPILPLLESGFTLSDSWDPVEPADSDEPGTAEIILANNSTIFEWVGYFDGAGRWSVDDREQLLYIVGILGDGTRVELADVLLTPFQRFVGVGSPTAGDDQSSRISVKIQRLGMGAKFSPLTYSEPCAVFPGGAVSINWGDNFDLGATGHRRYKFMCDDVTIADQCFEFKDSGTTGFSFCINPGGALPGGFQFLARGQSPVTTATSANVIQSKVSYVVAIDWTATTRRIDLNGVQLVLTTGITGGTTTNATNNLEGLGFVGRISEVTRYSTNKSVATALLEIRAPVLATDASLAGWVPHDEGSGIVVHDRTSGSSITGTLGAGATLTGTSGWHLSGLLGQYLPSFIGRVAHAPIRWFDLASQIATVCASGLQLVQALRFGFNPVSTANYSVDLPRGTLRLTTGTIPQAGAGVQALANSPWGTALNFDGVTMSATATQTGPAGSRALTGHIRCDIVDATLRYIGGRQSGGAAGGFYMRLTSTGGFNNRLEVEAINDAPASAKFTLAYAFVLPLDVRLFVAAVLDASAQRLSLWVDRAEVASMTTSGNWTTALSTWGTGCRPDTGGSRFVGIVDELLEWNKALTPAELKLLHLRPATGSETGLWYGHRLDEGAGGSAVSIVAGKAALTITSPIWGTGRCSAGDLSWQCYKAAGYPESARDSESWGIFIAAQPADCGWPIEEGQNRESVAREILAGVGARARELSGIVYVKRFEGVTGTPNATITLAQVRGGSVVASQEQDPAIYLWRLLSRINGLPLPAGEIAAALLTSDPAGYSYASREGEIAPASDESIRTRFPNALPMDRRTPFFKKADADREALRLRELFRHGGQLVELQVIVDVEDLAVLDEIPAIEGLSSARLDQSGSVVLSINNDGGAATIILWRPGD